MNNVKAVVANFYAHHGSRAFPVARITKTNIIVAYNDVARGMFRRSDGGARGVTWTPSRIENLAEIEKFANEQGGTWDNPEFKKKAK